VVTAPVQLNGQTVRQIVHTSLGGDRVRVRFSNAMARAPWSSDPRTWPPVPAAHRFHGNRWTEFRRIPPRFPPVRWR
jgi:hypothetical protein